MFPTERFKKQRVLGVAVGERSLRVAEVAGANGKHRVTHAANWSYPPGVGSDDPDALGRALAAFLRENAFTARRAVLGVPARWLICRGHTAPPVEAKHAHAMLRLRAEADTAPETGEMAFDYSGRCDAAAPARVTLFGLPLKRRERLSRLAAAAGLDVVAITPTITALAQAAPAGNCPILSLDSEGAELASFDGARVTSVRHLGASTTGPAVATDVRRTVALGSASAEPSIAAATSLTLWDDVGLDDADLRVIEDAAGVPVRRGDPQSLAPDDAAGSGGAAAVALGLAAFPDRRPEIDFLHPRLVATRQRVANRPALWAAGTAAAVALIGVAAYLDLRQIRERIATDDRRLVSLEPALAVAKPYVANMKLAETFRPAKPRALVCLRDLAELMPEDGQTYLTSFDLRADLKAVATGRSPKDRDVLDLVDKLNASGPFADVKCRLEGQSRRANAGGAAAAAGKAQSDVAFSVTFTYVPRP